MKRQYLAPAPEILPAPVIEPAPLTLPSGLVEPAGAIAPAGLIDPSPLIAPAPAILPADAIKEKERAYPGPKGGYSVSCTWECLEYKGIYFALLLKVSSSACALLLTSIIGHLHDDVI